MSETKIAAPKDYSAFNRFQQLFYTDILEFEKYTNYEIKQNSVTLLTNIAKGFPHLADQILNLYSPALKAIESPAMLKALQRTKFINNFSRPRVPQFIYYKSSTKKAKVEKEKVIKIPKTSIDFDMPIRTTIMEILMIDTKTYEYLKFNDKIQKLGKQLLGENIQTESIKATKKKKS